MHRKMALFVLASLLAVSASAVGEDPAPVPVPPAADVENATKLIRDLFKDEYAKTQTKARQALAEKLFKQAEETNDDPAARYALYREAADIAANNGDAVLALEALGALHAKYSGVKLEQDEPVFKALATKSPTADALIVANHLLRAVDDAVTADELEVAERIAALAVTAANRSKNVRTSSLAVSRVKDVDAFKKDAPQVKAALKAVEKGGADAAALTAAGKYYCFQRGEWEKGIPLLQGSDDAKLKAVAEKEGAGPREAAELLAVADAWYDVGSALPAHLKRGALGRAFNYYTKAAPDLSGLHKTRAEKRLDELEKVVERSQIDEFWGAVRSAVRNKEVEELKPVGGAFGDKDWRETAPSGGVLIGFNVGLAKFVNQDIIGALQPIYLTPTGEKLGTAYGKMPAKPTALKAKPGYAVGQINLRAGGGIDALSVTFMRIQGKALNATDKYESPSVGGQGGGRSPAIGDSRPIVGLFGKRESGGEEKITNIGLIVAGPKPTPPKKP